MNILAYEYSGYYGDENQPTDIKIIESILIQIFFFK